MSLTSYRPRFLLMYSHLLSLQLYKHFTTFSSAEQYKACILCCERPTPSQQSGKGYRNMECNTMKGIWWRRGEGCKEWVMEMGLMRTRWWNMTWGGREQVRPRGNSMKTGKVDERVRGEGQVVLRHKENGSLLLKRINGNCSYIKSWMGGWDIDWLTDIKIYTLCKISISYLIWVIWCD